MAKVGSITYDQFKSFVPPAAADELAASMQTFESPGYFVGEPQDAVDKAIELVAKVWPSCADYVEGVCNEEL
ncbi:hypothetical protein BT63DRAFT_426970 [Microthyrium microscopicum]|uniref:Uncharacterized protein n=1 Tax=Microthyrium microscopicum TaxID=703497 RepID=A0A6A6U314_9PEZI|nr:hypothetical protein BT63DRAFT_426970 [Microthyrium microscopicum]